MDKESLELQQKLLDKLDEWRNEPSFGKSKYDLQKYNRAKGMLQATHPKVLTEVLGITSVPNVPKDTMNLIRTMDLRTLENLEIFRGMPDKVVGHHMSAFGAIRGALENQSPDRRLELLNRVIESDYITGMDPSGIGPIRSSIHLPIAHQGDYSGKKPGYQVQTFTGDHDLEDIWKNLEASLKQQKGSFMEARAHQSTQDLISASEGVFGADLITDLDLPMSVREQASKAAKPLGPKLNQVITEFSGNNELIQKNAKALLEGTAPKNVENILDAGQKALSIQTNRNSLKLEGGSLRLRRQQVMGLAGAGLAGFSVLGTGASALETAERTKIASETGNPLDSLQAGLSGLSLGADFVPGVGELVSTPADAINVAIDTARDPRSLAEGAMRRRQQERKEKLQMKPASAPERSNKLSVGFAEGGF